MSNPITNPKVAILDYLRTSLTRTMSWRGKNVADQESFVDDVLDDIFSVYKDLMFPQEPEEGFDISDAFDAVSEAIGTVKNH